MQKNKKIIIFDLGGVILDLYVERSFKALSMLGVSAAMLSEKNCLMNEKMQFVLGPSDHGSTYGGNPVCCAGALSVINRLDEHFLSEVQAKSAYIFSELEGAEGILSVSGKGLMIGIETVRPAKDVVMDCMAKGVLCLTAKTKVRLLPALNIPMDVLAEAIAVIKEACKA